MLLVENLVERLLDSVYGNINLWNQIFMAILYSFLCGVGIGEYIVFFAFKIIRKKFLRKLIRSIKRNRKNDYFYKTNIYLST